MFGFVVFKGHTQGSHCHGKAWEKILSRKVMENRPLYYNAMEIENVLKKSWKCHSISLPLITNHAREVPIIAYL